MVIYTTYSQSAESDICRARLVSCNYLNRCINKGDKQLYTIKMFGLACTKFTTAFHSKRHIMVHFIWYSTSIVHILTTDPFSPTSPANPLRPRLPYENEEIWMKRKCTIISQSVLLGDRIYWRLIPQAVL